MFHTKDTSLVRNNRINQCNKSNSNTIDFILIFAIIYIQYSLWFLEYSAALRILLTLSLIGILLISHNFSLYINKKRLIILTLSLFLILLSCLINEVNIQIDGWNIAIWLCAFIITSIIKSNIFYETYSKTISILALFGVIIFCLSLFLPSIFLNFPVLNKQSWTGDTVVNNAFFCNVSLFSNYKRNFGIFYEPGLFAFHLNFALFLELFLLEKRNIKRITVLLIALLTTLSTSGFITTFFFLLSFFMNNHNKFDKKIINKLKGISSLLIFIAIFTFISHKSIWIFLTNKLMELNDNATSGSGFERFRALKLSVEAFSKNPLLGTGGTGWLNLFNGYIATFTPMNWFALYGILYGLLCFVLFFKIIFVKNNKFVSSLLQFCGLLTLIASQNVSNYLIVIIFILYNINTNINIYTGNSIARRRTI
ncbi:hypothetical protein [Heyndrickxia coagulans]|jgi:hypothetical protein|uniref:hypothetical protein n=1 Tax=Heyndrickxia TaxID=2837504 RepID=UPI0006288BF2|nr:hypothetical protein [Heyndrickxia coagulans]UXC22887.1 hypothetical protein N4P52_02335 [Heyndrickxia coagulans]